MQGHVFPGPVRWLCHRSAGVLLKGLDRLRGRAGLRPAVSGFERFRACFWPKFGPE
jgi:hypothetical protein